MSAPRGNESGKLYFASYLSPIGSRELGLGSPFCSSPLTPITLFHLPPSLHLCTAARFEAEQQCAIGIAAAHFYAHLPKTLDDFRIGVAVMIAVTAVNTTVFG